MGDARSGRGECSTGASVPGASQVIRSACQNTSPSPPSLAAWNGKGVTFGGFVSARATDLAPSERRAFEAVDPTSNTHQRVTPAVTSTAAALAGDARKVHILQTAFKRVA